MEMCMQCEHITKNIINETQMKYDVKVYQIRLLCNTCKGVLISKREDAKGISFKDWVIARLKCQ